MMELRAIQLGFLLLLEGSDHMLTIQFNRKWSFQRKYRYSRLEDIPKHFSC
jgi:hypothetical protein